MNLSLSYDRSYWILREGAFELRIRWNGLYFYGNEYKEEEGLSFWFYQDGTELEVLTIDQYENRIESTVEHEDCTDESARLFWSSRCTTFDNTDGLPASATFKRMRRRWFALVEFQQMEYTS